MCISTIRIILLVAIFINVIVGVGLIALGAIQVHFMHNHEVFPMPLKVATIYSIILGSVIVIVGSLGVYAVFDRFKCMINTFGFLMLIVFACTLLLAIFSLVYSINAQTIIQPEVKKSIENMMNRHVFIETKQMWTDIRDYGKMDWVQKTFKCCGINDSTNWIEMFKNKLYVPTSCCQNPMVCKMYWDKGCLNVFMDFVVEQLRLTQILASVSAVVQMLAIILAFCLSSFLDNYRAHSI